MNRPLENNNGFTLVELMVTILISAIIAGTITSYLVSNLKMYKTTQEITNIQYDGQLILNQMSEIAMESRGIYDTSVTNWEDVSTIGKPDYIVFNGVNCYNIFVYDDSTNELFYFKVDNVGDINPTIAATSEYKKHIFAKNVNNLIVITNDASTLKDCDAIEIIIELKSGDSSIQVQTEAKFRNKID